jgi:hypothetical protein
LAEGGKGDMDFLVQSTLCHLPVGKDDYEFKIAFAKDWCHAKAQSPPRLKEFHQKIFPGR